MKWFNGLALTLVPTVVFGQPMQNTPSVPPGQTIRTAPQASKGTQGSSAGSNRQAQNNSNGAQTSKINPTSTTGDPANSAGKKVATTKAPNVKMECLPNPVRIGEPLKCTVTMVHRENISVSLTLPEGAIPQPGDAAVAHGANRLKSTRMFVLTPKSMRKTKVQGLEVVWTEPDGAEGRAAIPVQKIPTASVMLDAPDPQFKTFKAPQGNADAFWQRHGPVPYKVTNWTAIIITIVVLVILLGFGIGYLVRRWLDGRRSEPEAWIDPRPAHIIALERLDALLTEDLPSQDRIDEYYVRISEIFRGYLERRYGINGLEMTSDEIRHWCRVADIPEVIRNQFDALLAESDLVKFADFRPSRDAITNIAHQARQVFEATQVNQGSTTRPTNEIGQIRATDEPEHPSSTPHAWAPPNRTTGQPDDHIDDDHDGESRL